MALVVASALGYGLFVAVGRILDPADFATFAALWGLLFGAGSVLGLVEQETGRVVALRLAVGQRLVGTQARLLLISLGLAALLVAIGAMAFPTTVERALGGSWQLFAVAAVAAGGFAVQFVVRGAYAGSGRIGRYAAVVVVEALLRVAVLVIVVVAASRVSVLWCAVAVASGSFAWLLVPPTGRAQASAERAVCAPPSERDECPVAWSDLARDMGSLTLAAAFSAAVITGFPALAAAVAPADDRAELGVLLAALTVTRIPLLAIGPIQAMLVPELVRRTEQDGWPVAVRLVRQTIWGLLALGVVGFLAALAVGPATIRLMYGPKYDIDGLSLAALTVGAALMAIVLILAAALVSLQRHRWVIVTWIVCLAVVLVVITAPWGAFFDRCVAALLVGPVAALGVASLALASPRNLTGERRQEKAIE